MKSLSFRLDAMLLTNKGIERDQESTEYRQDKKSEEEIHHTSQQETAKGKKAGRKQRTGRMVATFSEEDMAMRPVSVKAEWRIMPL